MKTEPKYTGLEIAVTGIACQVPGAVDWRGFWDNLTKEVEGTYSYSRQELIDLNFEAKTLVDKRYIPVIAGLRGKNLFDAAFFDYTPLEAGLMNPVNRIFHQCIWEALEDAGYNPEKIKGPIGIFAGAGDDSNWILYARLKNRNKELDDFSLNNIANKDFLASLVSYKLNLKGPVMSVNTTCSTSLVTINQACKSLLLGEAEIALAGGITIRSEPQLGYFYTEGLIFSADGHCRAFDKDASGTVATEGAGIVVLKRLNKAIEDRDHIYAIIKGGAVNNDGNRKVGFMASSVEGQVDCIRKAHKFAKVTPESISYVEAHGTGTRLGDPIEVEALSIAFNNNKEHRCALGSVKTNIGHLDTAAGVAGLIKTALCLKHRQLPASLYFREANPEIDFSAGPFYVNTSLQAWQQNGNQPLRAGVSSFGIGGTNAHVIMEEAPEQESSGKEQPFKLLSLSARTSQSLTRYLEKLKHFLSSGEDVNLSDMCYTLHTGRKAFAYRLSAVFQDAEELKTLLHADQLQAHITKVPDRTAAVVFMFPGQGSQYAGMSKDLYENESVFRAQMDEGFALLETLTGESFKTILFSAEEKINNTRYAQPLLFLVEYSMAMLLQHLGVKPQYMIGHSIGEYVAACLSGIFSFPDALRLVAKRGELMSGLEKGNMLSIPLTEQAAQVYINDGISLAAVNSPAQIVLSGDSSAVNALKQQLENDDLPFIQLHTSHAFHSAMMDPVKAAFKKELEQVTFHQQEIPVISNLQGTFIEDKDAGTADYWVRHMRETVRFSEGISFLLSQNREIVFIEVGAGHSLLSLLRQQQAAATGVNLLRTVKEQDNDEHYLTKQLGKLWSHGINIDWEVYYKTQKRHKVSLPIYSFEPVPYPTEVDPFSAGLPADLMPVNKHPELKDWLYYPTWKRGQPTAPISSERKGVWLFFSFDELFSGQVKLEMKHHYPAAEIIEVFQGTEYARLSACHYIIDPAEASHYDSMFSDLTEDLTDIVYGWGIAAEEDMPAYFGLINLVKSMLRNNRLKERRINVLTDRLHPVIGQEAGSCGQSLLLGLVNVLPQEYSVKCVNIDLSLNENTTVLADQLIAEILSDSAERIIALRNGRRWIKEYVKNNAVLSADTDKILQCGTYIVTGGLGNVGSILSRFLLEKYNATVIVTGRQPEALLQRAAQAHYESLLNISKEVYYYMVDVADASALEQTVLAVEERFGRVAGVIHAAGIIAEDHFELVEDMTAAKVIAVLKPKVTGVQSLHEVFAKRSPDFVWLTSSLSAVLGGLGFGAYASANLYMDHYVQSKDKWHSVDLGEMAFSSENIERESGRSRHLLKPEELCQLFVWSLGLKDTPVIIQTIEELSTRLHKIYEVKKDTYLDQDNPEEESSQKAERSGLSTAYQPADTAMEIRMVAVFERFFSITGIGINDNFFELGGDSLKAMMLLKRIKKEFDINISLTDFFNHDSIKSCAAFIHEMKTLSNRAGRTSKIII